MKIQIKSDLHLETWYHETRALSDQGPLYTHPEADVLVLAGDIVDGKSHRDLVAAFGDSKIPVIFVPGNHEYYDSQSVRAQRLVYPALFKDTAITLLDTDSRLINDVLFIGATLWTDLSNPLDAEVCRIGLGCFHHIPGMNANYWTQMHSDDRHYIDRALNFDVYKDTKKVVITHYLPSQRSVSQRFKNDALNVGFVGNCDDFLDNEKSPELWIHGHTHDSCDYQAGKTRIVCNPFGYSGGKMDGLNKGYIPDLIVEV